MFNFIPHVHIDDTPDIPKISNEAPKLKQAALAHLPRTTGMESQI
jgi:hypothetical protein